MCKNCDPNRVKINFSLEVALTYFHSVLKTAASTTHAMLCSLVWKPDSPSQVPFLLGFVLNLPGCVLALISGDTPDLWHTLRAFLFLFSFPPFSAVTSNCINWSRELNSPIFKDDGQKHKKNRQSWPLVKINIYIDNMALNRTICDDPCIYTILETYLLPHR